MPSDSDEGARLVDISLRGVGALNSDWPKANTCQGLVHLGLSFDQCVGATLLISELRSSGHRRATLPVRTPHIMLRIPPRSSLQPDHLKVSIAPLTTSPVGSIRHVVCCHNSILARSGCTCPWQDAEPFWLERLHWVVNSSSTPRVAKLAGQQMRKYRCLLILPPAQFGILGRGCPEELEQGPMGTARFQCPCSSRGEERRGRSHPRR